MAVTFTTKVQWPDNPRRLQATDFGIKVPSGLSDAHVREPNFVDVSVMSTKSKEHAVGQGSALSIVNGLVTRELGVTFANPEQQWKELSGSKTGPGRFQFQGGEMFLELQLGIYVILHVKPDPADRVSKQIFAEVYGHELLHVVDEVTLLESLPDDLKGDAEISKLLTQPFNYGTSRQTMAAAATEFPQEDWRTGRERPLGREDQRACRPARQPGRVQEGPGPHQHAAGKAGQPVARLHSGKCLILLVPPATSLATSQS